MDKPNDHTQIIYSVGKEIHYMNIFYKDYDKYEKLPNVAKSRKTKKEYHAFWKYIKEEE